MDHACVEVYKAKRTWIMPVRVWEMGIKLEIVR